MSQSAAIFVFTAFSMGAFSQRVESAVIGASSTFGFDMKPTIFGAENTTRVDAHSLRSERDEK